MFPNKYPLKLCSFYLFYINFGKTQNWLICKHKHKRRIPKLPSLPDACVTTSNIWNLNTWSPWFTNYKLIRKHVNLPLQVHYKYTQNQLHISISYIVKEIRYQILWQKQTCQTTPVSCPLSRKMEPAIDSTMSPRTFGALQSPKPKQLNPCFNSSFWTSFTKSRIWTWKQYVIYNYNC